MSNAFARAHALGSDRRSDGPSPTVVLPALTAAAFAVPRVSRPLPRQTKCEHLITSAPDRAAEYLPAESIKNASFSPSPKKVHCPRARPTAAPDRRPVHPSPHSPPRHTSPPTTTANGVPSWRSSRAVLVPGNERIRR